MPRIELALPGESREHVQPVADTYRITIERSDGIACTDIEASTVMSMWNIESAQKRARKGRKKQPATPE